MSSSSAHHSFSVARDATRHDFTTPATAATVQLPRGLSRDIVTHISTLKNEPAWMRDERLAVEHRSTRASASRRAGHSPIGT